MKKKKNEVKEVPKTIARRRRRGNIQVQNIHTWRYQSAIVGDNIQVQNIHTWRYQSRWRSGTRIGSD